VTKYWALCGQFLLSSSDRAEQDEKVLLDHGRKQ
jgi:hypothetical protein